MKTCVKGYNQPSLNGDGEMGRDIDEAIEIVKRCEQYGVDMINCSTGSYDAFFCRVSPCYLDKGYNVRYASRLKAALHIFRPLSPVQWTVPPPCSSSAPA